MATDTCTVRGTAPLSALNSQGATAVHELTALDRHVGTRLCVLPWVFFYRTTLDSNLLKSSLSQVLDAFPLAAGRVVPVPQPPGAWWLRLCASNTSSGRQRWHLICSNAGVPFTTTTTAASNMGEVLKGGRLARRGFKFPTDPSTTATEHVEPMDPIQVLQGGEALLKVRLTQVEGGGSILGVTASHILVDGRSFTTFMHYWAQQYNLLLAHTTHPASNPQVKAMPVAAPPLQQQGKDQLTQVLQEAAPQAQAPSTAAPTADSDQRKAGSDIQRSSSTQSSSSSEGLDAVASIPVVPATAPKPTSGHTQQHTVYAPHPLEATQVPTHSSWREVFQAGIAAAASIRRDRQAAKQLAAGSSGSSVMRSAGGLSTELIHIPASDVCQLKELAGQYCHPSTDGSSVPYISTNDAVSSLVWVLMCYLRKRPLPGQPRPFHLHKSCLGLAVDLRTLSGAASTSSEITTTTTTTQPRSQAAALDSPAGSDSAALDTGSLSSTVGGRSSSSRPAPTQAGRQVAGNYWGSAAWSIHVRAVNPANCFAAEAGGVQEWSTSGSTQDWQELCSDPKVLQAALAAGAVRVRASLNVLRADGRAPEQLLRQVAAGAAAPLTTQLLMTANLVTNLDAFITSWQFPIWSTTFSHASPAAFQGLVHPVPPYHAVAMPAPPHEDMQQGVYLWVTVPSELVQVMLHSLVLQHLVPGARCVTTAGSQ